MSKRRILQTGVDMAMAAILPLLMAYSMVGEAAHEWLGVAMLCLFIVHHALNHHSYAALFRGRRRAARILNMLINLLLMIDMLLLGISGVMMSGHVFAFLNISGGASLARGIHLPCAYWGFILMSFHTGLHWQAVLGRIRALRKADAKPIPPALPRLLVILISAYGIYAFFKRDFPAYMLLQTQFAFFDFDEALIFYLLDMLAIMVLCAALGYYCMKLLTKIGKRKGEVVSGQWPG